MATRKAGTAAKKTVKKSTAAKPSTTTNVTTVKAVSTSPTKPAVSRKKIDYAADARILAAEFIGTFMLASIYIITKGEPLYLGFALIAIVLSVGALSGAHVNPLLTVGAWVTRKMSAIRALAYIVAQILGAVAALGLLTTFIAAAPAPAADSQQALMGGAQTPELYKIAQIGDVAKNKEWYVFFAEIVGALIFSFAVARAWQTMRTRSSTATAFNVGLGLFVAALVAGVAASYVSANAVINPALALAVGAIDWTKINLMAAAVYFIAPLIGGVLGFALSDAIRSDEKEVAKEA